MGAVIVAKAAKSKEKLCHVGRTPHLVRVSSNKTLSWWCWKRLSKLLVLPRFGP